MTENTTATAPGTTADGEETANAERDRLHAERVAKVTAALDDFGRMAVDRLIGQVTARNADVDRLNTVGGDRISRLDAMRAELAAGEGSYDLALRKAQDDITALQETLAQRLEDRDKALNEKIDAEVADSDVDPEALKEAIKVQDGNIRSGLNYATGIYGDDVKLLLPEQKALKGSRKGGGASAGGGSGKRRLRGFDVYVNGVKATTPDKDGVQKSSFSAAAKVVGLKSVEPLSEAYRAKFGDDPDNFPADATLPFEHDGATFEVRAVRV